jgi:hypothetical protein
MARAKGSVFLVAKSCDVHIWESIKQMTNRMWGCHYVTYVDDYAFFSPYETRLHVDVLEKVIKSTTRGHRSRTAFVSQ